MGISRKIIFSLRLKKLTSSSSFLILVFQKSSKKDKNNWKGNKSFLSWGSFTKWLGWTVKNTQKISFMTSFMNSSTKSQRKNWRITGNKFYSSQFQNKHPKFHQWIKFVPLSNLWSKKILLILIMKILRQYSKFMVTIKSTFKLIRCWKYRNSLNQIQAPLKKTKQLHL